MPAYPFGEKLQPSTRRAKASKSSMTGSGSAGCKGTLYHALGEQPLTGTVAAVQDRSAAGQRGGGEHEAGWLHEAEPLEVRSDVGIWASLHGHQFVSGHRYTSPTGSVRLAWTS